jgi:hypothetical protein
LGDSIVVDVFSTAIVPIELMFNSTSLSLATGFIWSHLDVFYLVTNWHNVSGKDCFTGNNLSPTGGQPNRVRVYLNSKGRIGDKFSEIFDLYDKHGTPKWITHPGQIVDIALLPLSPKEEPDWYAINKLQNLPLSVSIGQDVYILGYPFGINSSGYPIWKRASIASEPQLRTQEQPYILVDTASRPGMSGSPVIRRSWGNHTLSTGDLLTHLGPGTRFIGVYSGRLFTKDPLDAQLGLVWPAMFIDEILAG